MKKSTIVKGIVAAMFISTAGIAAEVKAPTSVTPAPTPTQTPVVQNQNNDPFDAVCQDIQEMQSLQDNMLNQMPRVKLRRFDVNAYPQSKFNSDKNAYTLTYVVPGMPKEDLSVKVDGNTLTISGNYVQKTDKKDKTSSMNSQVAQEFTQSLTIPNDVVVDKISSNYKDGVLTVTLPRNEKQVDANTKTITIQ